jgi:ribosomal protein L22
MTPPDEQPETEAKPEAAAKKPAEKKPAAVKKPAAEKETAETEESADEQAEAKAASKTEAKKPAAKKPAAPKKPVAAKKPATGKNEGEESKTQAKATKAADAEKPAKAEKPAPAARSAARTQASTPRRKVVRAQARYVRTSARKARMVCGHLRGKSVAEARAILAFTPREVARDWSKLLESAVANAENNHELIEDDLLVREAFADEGPTIKRFRPRAQGRATPIRKRTSHLTITLTPKA